MFINECICVVFATLDHSSTVCVYPWILACARGAPVRGVVLVGSQRSRESRLHFRFAFACQRHLAEQTSRAKLAHSFMCDFSAGFITMTPQLFINYKLQSVAHLPWSHLVRIELALLRLRVSLSGPLEHACRRFLVYKTLNTFIDDMFAFVIRMPTMHRLRYVCVFSLF